MRFIFTALALAAVAMASVAAPGPSRNVAARNARLLAIPRFTAYHRPARRPPERNAGYDHLQRCEIPPGNADGFRPGQRDQNGKPSRGSPGHRPGLRVLFGFPRISGNLRKLGSPTRFDSRILFRLFGGWRIKRTRSANKKAGASKPPALFLIGFNHFPARRAFFLASFCKSASNCDSTAKR